VSEHSHIDALGEYALGTLEPAEAVRLERHLKTCASCRAELDEFRSVVDVLPVALPAGLPPAALYERIAARLNTPSLATSPRPPAAWTTGLAAALALALATDAWLAVALRGARHELPAVVARMTPAAAGSPLERPTPMRASVRRTSPAPLRSHATAAPPLAVPSAASRSATAVPLRDFRTARLRARIAELERELAGTRRSSQAAAARNARELAHVRRELDGARRDVAPANAVPVPSATAGGPGLVAALSNGRVFAVDGTVASEPWHLTILQPSATANARIFSQVPHAPPGDTYRTWVLRGGKTYDAGELPAGTQAELEMPMPLRDGDVVAFSREPVSTRSAPTTPFLMQVTIKE